MKTVLLYGPGEIAKRQELSKIKNYFPSGAVTVINLKEAEEKDLQMALASRSLFENGPRLVTVENAPEKLDLKVFKSGEEGLVLLLVGGNLKSSSILLQSAKEMSARVNLFEGEGELLAFPYLDNLIERKTEAFVELEKLLAQYGGVYILTMIYYLLRRNLLPLPQSAFVQKKVKAQRGLYRDEDWPNLYQMTLQTEFKIKSGAVSEKEALVYLTGRFVF